MDSRECPFSIIIWTGICADQWILLLTFLLCPVSFKVSRLHNNKQQKWTKSSCWCLMIVAELPCQQKGGCPFLGFLSDFETVLDFSPSLLFVKDKDCHPHSLTEDYQYWVDGGVGQGQGDGKQASSPPWSWTQPSPGFSFLLLHTFSRSMYLWTKN